MATAQYGIALLDLSGNRPKWSSSDTSHATIRLLGSHFHDTLAMATLVISGICFLSFLAIFVSLCCVCCSRKHTRKYLLWTPIFCMIGFFATDITNRVCHELEETWSSAYLGIDIAMGSLTSIADGALQVYLWKKSPVDLQKAGPVPYIAMILSFTMFTLLSLATKGTQGYSLFQVLNPDPTAGKPLKFWQDLGSAASGMLLLFAIGFFLFSATYIRRLPKTPSRYRLLRIALGVLASSFLARNAVQFTFVLIYSQYNHVASLGVQLVYMVFYGILSVIVYFAIIIIAAVQEKEQPLEDEPIDIKP